MRLVEESITLRDAAAKDLEFLAELYHDTRREEVAAWGWPQAQQEQFLRMQFDAQRRSYQIGFPNSIDRIVCREEMPMGHLLVDREPAALRLIDIALLREHRNCGIGTLLLRDLLKDCQSKGCHLRLQVLQGNPAMRLYQRLGFQQTESDFVYVQMEWSPE